MNKQIPEGWKLKKLKTILNIGSGKDYKHLDKGNVPVYGTGGVMCYVDSYLYDGISVGIGRKGTINKPLLLQGKFWTIDTLFYTYNFKNVTPEFVYYKFLTVDWLKYNEASGLPSLSKNTIEGIVLDIPPIAEQHKIATILSTWDRGIAQQEQLIAEKKVYKQGVMQQLLTGKKRFPGFTDQWKEVKLGDVGKIKMCKRIFLDQTSTNGEIPFFKIGTLGYEPDSYIKRDLFVEYKNKYNFPNKGDVLITCSGTIGRCVQFDGKDAYFQDSNIVWLDNNEIVITNNFLYKILQNVNWNTLNSTTITRLYTTDLKSLKLKIPTLKEQEKIASFLSAIDKEIEILEKELEGMRTQKWGLMQQLLTGKVRVMNS
ncbi:restriction endonuclease subunit S [Myroides pelagicus]|uniref:Restriction endonuclease subunit S n=1 Tax=Myroides pelagicus TaxID=270914 RepID=A0A7K1GLG4_9FLAO|nr:restriction endonuclease subunit S [Myroides pelagicus]MTH29715.1 restriction endonuclease subunit S [Myroides pelagicus]